MQALAKYAFGLGTVTMVLCTLVFTGMSLPPGQGLGTQILVKGKPFGLILIEISTDHCKLLWGFCIGRMLRQDRGLLLRCYIYHAKHEPDDDALQRT